MISSYIILLLAAIPLMGSPGPATLSLAATGSAFGFKASFGYLAGIVLGTSTVLLMIAMGVFTILSTSPVLTVYISVGAAMYILYLAWRIAMAPVVGTQEAISTVPGFVAGFLLSIVNPKAYAAIGAVYSGHVIYNNAPVLDSAAKILSLSIVICIVNTVWLAFGAAFSRVLVHRVHGRIINIVFSLLLVLSVVAVFRQG